jgi:pimeloyl-ACP methyl ester carboxylesterase
MRTPFVLTSLVGLSLGPAALAATLALSPCTPPGTHEAAECGTFQVPEDRAHPEGRTIGLHVVLIPATSRESAADVVTYFAGGPGGSATDEGLGFLRNRALREHHRLLLVDARGTGQSAPLNCPQLQGIGGVQGFLDNFMPAPEVKTCADQVSEHADVRFYTSAPAVDDVDDVRQALGIDKLDLIGGSYGTRASLEYLRRHGDHVRSAVLMGVDPPGSRGPLTYARDAQKALDGLLARCLADAGCKAAFPHIQDEFMTVLNRLKKSPVEVPAIDPSTAKPITIRLSASGFAQTIRYMLYVPSTAVFIPLYVHRAATAGDFKPLTMTAITFSKDLGGSSDGFYLSVMCPEEVRLIPASEVPAAIANTFLGDFRIRQQQAACAAWPTASVPAELEDAVKSDVPVLLINGQLDPVTPVYRAEQALRTLPNGKLLVTTGGAHSQSGMQHLDCLDKMIGSFVVAGTSQGLDTSCVATVLPPPFGLKLAEERTLKMSPRELGRFVGTFRSADGEVKITLDGDHLLMDSGDQKAVITPVGAKRFRVEGMPQGFDVIFERKAGHPLRLILHDGPGPGDEYEAVKP